MSLWKPTAIDCSYQCASGRLAEFTERKESEGAQMDRPRQTRPCDQKRLRIRAATEVRRGLRKDNAQLHAEPQGTKDALLLNGGGGKWKRKVNN